MRLALIGFGGLGSIVAEHLARDSTFQFVGVAARPTQRDRVHALLGGVPIVDSAKALLALKPDVVIECASQGAFRQYAQHILGAGVDLIAVSAGVLAEADYRKRLLAIAQGCGASLQIPAGAIGAIDVIAAARHAGLSRVTFVARRNPRAWAGSPAASMIDLHAVRHAVLFFHDTAERASLLFTAGANVTATLALAGVGFHATRVQLWADPAVTQSIHHIEADGACGALRLDLANNMAPNGATSLLTAMSIVQAVRNRAATLRF